MAGGDNKDIELRAAESVQGEFIKNQELQIKKLADYNPDPVIEERIRRMSYYNYYFHIFALKKRQEEIEADKK